MQSFARLYTDLDQTNSTIKKVQSLVEYFSGNVMDQDKIWAVALFMHRRPKRTVSTGLLRRWSAEISGIPLWLFEDNYHIIGDLAETIALVLPPPISTNNFGLSYWIEYIKQLKNKDDETKKTSVLNAWAQMGTNERFIFNKIVTGGMRIGVSDKLVIQALAKVTELAPNTIAHKLTGDWSADNISWNDLLFKEDNIQQISKPYPFYLSYPFSAQPGDNNFIETTTWAAEWKWDGIRCQYIKRGDLIFLWSRGEELMTDKFPEFKADHILFNGIVLDGEIIAFKDDKPLGFNVLQTRIGRKQVTAKIQSDAPVKFIAYDILEFEGRDIRNLAFLERRQILDKLINSLDPASNIMISPLLNYNNFEELKQIRDKAREVGAEGLMLKKVDGAYLTGRKTGEMWKWKLDPYSIDAVMIYAQRGHGRRANLYSDFTFALWDGDRLVPFTKAYSGLRDKEMIELTKFVKNNTLETFGPVCSVRPLLVFEIAFEGISPSSRHKAGIALRFPRIKQWRKDKTADKANTLEEIKKLL